jgi:hypothetical protein
MNDRLAHQLLQRLLKYVLAACALVAASLPALSAAEVENLVFITWDGFRWQEMFHGADESLMNKEVGGVPDIAGLKASFWRDTPEERREVLLPFVWGVVARQGQIFGDPERNAASRVTNGRKFSYPGYSEMFVGFGDERIASNDKVLNPNINVLEYIHRQPGFQGKVAAFATWDVIEFVLNAPRSGFPVLTGWTQIDETPLSEGQKQVNEMVRQLPRVWRGNAFDMITFQAAREYLLKHRPRVLYIGLGETDEWGHGRRYDLYLEAARRSDQYVRELWDMLQSLPQYRDKTALVLTTDHGRGTGREWTSHGVKIAGAENIWIAVLAPGVPALGVRQQVETTQSQVAATLARLLTIDFQAAVPQAAKPLTLQIRSADSERE